jgi:hypothetical protein
MSAIRPGLVQQSTSPERIERAFREGCAIAVPWPCPTGVRHALTALEQYLATLPVEQSFSGANQLSADRQTFWVASTGLAAELHDDPADLARFDGDTAGGERGLEALLATATWAALSVIRAEIDRSLRLCVEGLRLDADLPQSHLDRMSPASASTPTETGSRRW